MNPANVNSIMVIGADLHFCYLMQRYVRESEHPLLFCEPDEKAVGMAEREQPALIVLEAGLPGAKFQQILGKLKTDQKTSEIPVMLCSWQESDPGESNNRADIFLRMPILYGDFLKVLTNLGI